MLKLYHTYKKALIPFQPIQKGKIGMYHCGPTVYDYLTIGNLRSFVIEDLFRRALEYLGYDVRQVMNITDVGHLTMTDVQKEEAKLKGCDLELTDTDEGLDRMEKAAKREGLSVWDVAAKYTKAIFGSNWEKAEDFSADGDFGKLNILKPNVLCRVTDHIEEQIEFIKLLEKKGYTYKTKEAVYFDITKFPRYEALIGQKFEDMRKGKRACTSDPARKHPADFRLWQFEQTALDQPDHEMQWDSPWGRGFPGWHIECSAMSYKYLGQPFDIHTGGEDHIKLHHANEIAQSEGAFDKPMANYWLHVLFLTVEGRRMGKSLGNAYTLKDIEKKGFNPLDLRYFYLQAHYRTRQNFTWESLKAAQKAREKLARQVQELLRGSKGSLIRDKQVSEKWRKKFIQVLEEDFNFPKALAVCWDLLKSDEENECKLATILDFDKVFGLKLDNVKDDRKQLGKEVELRIKDLVNKREKARKAGDWEQADQIRDSLLQKYNVVLEDTKAGVKWEVE